MHKHKPFVISVTGAHSGVGKTTICSILLEHLKGFGAIKFTKTPLYASIVDDIDVLSNEGKDTALYLEAGAKRVVWVRSPYHELAELMSVAFERVGEVQGIIVEGNSPVDFLKPHLIIFIKDRGGEIKPSAINVSKKADIVIINAVKGHGKEDLTSGSFKDKAIVFRIDIKNREGEIDEFVSCVKKRVAQVPD
jgi:molybdopterin-guanine dinucleotide biosynthesis protein